MFAFLPFRGLMDAPSECTWGTFHRAKCGRSGASGCMDVALILLGRFTLSRGIRRMVVQGG